MRHKLDAREYKILLNPAKFNAPLSHATANEFWDRIRPIINNGPKDREAGDGFNKLVERKVKFWDTHDCILTAADLALRSRLEIRDGAAADEHELTLKLRMTDFFVVSDTPFGQSSDDEKPELEEDISPLEVQLPDSSAGLALPPSPSSRSRYSLTAKRRVVWEASHPAETTLTRLFPAAATLVPRALSDEWLKCGPEIHEYAAKGAGVDFGAGITGKFTLTLWNFDDEAKTSVAELSFKCDTPNGEMPGKAARRALALFNGLQTTLGDYINRLHSSKTALALPRECRGDHSLQEAARRRIASDVSEPRIGRLDHAVLRRSAI